MLTTKSFPSTSLSAGGGCDATAYAFGYDSIWRYFNKKYDSSGAVFESTYKASMIMVDEYLMHISRYIHLNPKNWRAYPYSSLPFYLGAKPPGWLNPGRINNLFVNPEKYREFVEDYEDYKAQLETIKSELANS